VLADVMVWLAKIPSKRDESQILEFGDSFGGDFPLGKGCSVITDRRGNNTELAAKDQQTHFSHKRWSGVSG
jgi:hypothetical protein